jgi:acetyl esterase/lipase
MHRRRQRMRLIPPGAPRRDLLCDLLEDRFRTVAPGWALAQRFAADYRKAGGDIDLLLLEGAQHTFLNEHPFEPNSVKALNAMIAFIKKHGAERHAQR